MRRSLRPIIGLAGILLIVMALSGPLCSCASDTRAIDEAYERGYADGLAVARQEARDSFEEAYDLGFEEGLQSGEERQTAEVCQDCYGLGFREGYEHGYAEGSSGNEPIEANVESRFRSCVKRRGFSGQVGLQPPVSGHTGQIASICILAL